MTTDDLILEEPCPFCKAKPGKPCRSAVLRSGLRPTPHLERINAYYRSLR